MVKLKKILIPLLCILTLFTSCIPSVDRDIPVAPENSPVADAPDRASVKTKKVAYFTLNDDPEYYEYCLGGFSDAMNDLGIEYEIFTMEGYGGDIESLLYAWINDPAEDKAAILDADFSSYLITSSDSKIKEAWISSRIPTIHIWTNGIEEYRDEISLMDGHILIEQDYKSAGTLIAESAAELLSGKDGKLLIGSYISASSEGMHYAYSCFGERWQELRNEYVLKDIVCENIALSKDDPMANAGSIYEFANKNDDCVGMVVFGSFSAGEGYNLALEKNSAIKDWVMIDMDASEADIKLLSDGVIDVIVDTPYYDMGYQAGICAEEALYGKITNTYITVPYKLIDE